jgi:3-oxoacyl-[acyl-carrier-protein] synthase-3
MMKSALFLFLAVAQVASTIAFVSPQKALIAKSARASEATSTQLGVTGGPLRCRPIGTGSAYPKTQITNTDLEAVVETSDEWIKTRTGIGKRHVLLQGESVRSLGVEAAQEAMKMAGISVDEIDIVICATSTPDDMFGDAPWIAASLGCGTNTMAFDLTAACSGFLFATLTAGKFLSGPGTFRNALVIGADSLSRWVDWDDRNTCILFGDGAGAMVLTRDESTSGFLGYASHTNGNGYEDLKCE